MVGDSETDSLAAIGTRGFLALADEFASGWTHAFGVGYRIEIGPADMDADDFRRIALSFEGAEESSHMGAPDFRVGGRIFATLASEKQGYGNLMITVEQQAAFVEELPEIFVPIAGGWGQMGMTHIRLAAASEDVLAGALHTAWKLRVEKNGKAGKQTGAKTKGMRAGKTCRKKR
jgi:hypothetical protein